MTSLRDIDLDIPVVREYIRNATPESRIYLGCDSDEKNGRITFARVVVIHRFVGESGQGCKVFGEYFTRKLDFKRPQPLQLKLMEEVYYAAEIADQIKDIVGKRIFEIHIDVNKNPQYASNTVMAEAMGLIRGMSLIPKIKPDAIAANAVADAYSRIVNKYGGM